MEMHAHSGRPIHSGQEMLCVSRDNVVARRLIQSEKGETRIVLNDLKDAVKAYATDQAATQIVSFSISSAMAPPRTSERHSRSGSEPVGAENCVASCDLQLFVDR